MSTLHVELLTKARERIAGKRDEFVCIALMGASNDLEYGHSAADQIEKHIDILIGRPEYTNTTLDQWMYRNMPGSIDLYERGCGFNGDMQARAEYDAKMRDARLRWIDWLIEEWRDAP